MNTVSMPFDEFLEESVKEKTVKMKWMDSREFSYPKNIEQVANFIDAAIEIGLCAVDLETTGLNTRMVLKSDGERVPGEKIVGIGVCYNPKFGMYIPINHLTGSEHNLPEKEVLQEIARLCKFCVSVYHNAKFDLAMLRNHGVVVDDFNMFEDTLILARLYDSGRKEINLKKLSESLLDQKMLEFKDVTTEVKRFDLVNPVIGYVYGVSDVVCTLDLYKFFMSQKIVQNQKLVYNLEKRVVFVVMEMENNLIKMDIPYLKGLLSKAQDRAVLRKKEVYELAGREFNIGSPKQLGELLFDELGYPYPAKEKTASGQYSTNDKTLKKIEDSYPVIAKILEFRKLEKLIGTYLKKLVENADSEGFVKLGFNQSGTDTGRFSSPGGYGLLIDGHSGVNVQSIPKKADKANPDLYLRKAFIARDPDKTLVAIDYENEEMRIATNLSHETVWIDAVHNGVDFHTTTGGLITGKDPKDVTPDERKIGKMTNFLSLYLGGPYTLSEQAKISVPEAKRILAAYFAGLPKLKGWIDSEIAKARKIKYVKTIFGRTRSLKKNYACGDKGQAAHADRCAINSQVQGAAADIMKAVMVKVFSWVHRNNLQDDIKILITMHDELVFEITTNKMPFLVPELSKIMMLSEVITNQLRWDIPLTVDVLYGENWSVPNNFYEEFPKLKKTLNEPIFETVPSSKKIVDKEPKDKGDGKLKNTPVVDEKVSETSQTEKISETSQTEKIPETSQTEKIPETSQTEKIPETSQTEKIPEKISETPQDDTSLQEASEEKYLIYTVRDTSSATKRNLNFILDFMMNENSVMRDSYEGPKRILKLKDKDGHSLLVSEIKVPVDCFRGLARIFRV